MIEYETDWNIEIEKDDDGHTLNVDEDDEYTAGTPMDISEPGPSARSPSVASQVPPGSSRRGPRGPYKKTLDTSTLSESIDAEGRLPGSKDGLGAFPPGSHWAKTMLALKLKGRPFFISASMSDVDVGCFRKTLSHEEGEDAYRERGTSSTPRWKPGLY